MMQPWILIVSGSSSSGKSTLCRAVLAALPAPAVLIEADTTFPSLSNWPKNGSLPAPIVVFHRSVVAWWAAGVNVVFDGSLPYGDEGLRRECLAQLPMDRTFTIAVSCSLDELRRRETARPDARPVGWAERQAADINDGLDPIAFIDTTDDGADVHARAVLAALARNGLL